MYTFWHQTLFHSLHAQKLATRWRRILLVAAPSIDRGWQMGVWCYGFNFKVDVNECGFEVADKSTRYECERTCAHLVHALSRQNDLKRGRCNFHNKGAAVHLVNAVYARRLGTGFAIEEEGGVMQTTMSNLKNIGSGDLAHFFLNVMGIQFLPSWSYPRSTFYPK